MVASERVPVRLSTAAVMPAAVRRVAVDAATWLHAHPETSWKEHQSAAYLREVLSRGGFQLTEIDGLPTAFVADAGSSNRRVVLCAEYDALPGIGHGCGHHLIAGAALGAALILLPLLDELGISLRVVGTPAEERGGGKISLLCDGVFDNAEAALMVHFVPDGFSANPVGTSSFAVGRERVTFRGRAAHAAAAPHEGRNASDASVVAQVGIGLLRQQMRPDERVGLHVVSGGESTNIIPAQAILDIECRSPSYEGYLALRDRVHLCLRAGALATQCTHEVRELEPVYQPLLQDERLSAAWSTAMGARGYDTDQRALPCMVATDMGNVSRHVPSIHPWVSIPGVQAAVHTVEFAQASAGPAALDAMIKAGEALADTVRAIA